MTYDEAISQLRKFKKVIVTGPQRSGTTIAGKMIAGDLSYRYVDEGFHSVGSNIGLLTNFLSDKEKIVVQCPILAFQAHNMPPGWAVVFMRRNVDDIHRSQKRINWEWDEAEKKQYKKLFAEERPGVNIDFNRRISAIKYIFWDSYQKSRVKNKFEIAYESLSTHPMWLSKDQRKGFGAKQTELKG